MKLIQKAIVKKDNTFLILLRSSEAEFFPKHWDFPGGKLEEGEDPIEGIEREVFEETGLKIKTNGIVGAYEMVLKGIPHRFTVYDTDGFTDDVRISHEHLAFKWATKEEILALNIEPYMREYFKEHP